MRYPIQLKAGIPVKQFFRGRGLSIVSTGAATDVGVKVFRTDEQDVEDFGACDRNFSLYYQEGDFIGAEFSATVDTVVEVIVSRARVTLQDGANVTATIDAAQLPLAVATTRGTAPGNPFFVSGLTLDTTPAGSNANAAPVAVAGAAVQVAAANVNVLERRFSNLGTDPVALGALGITWANRAVVLQPGDVWIETKGAALAWYGITAGGASSIGVQELRA